MSTMKTNAPEELPEGWQQTSRAATVRPCPSCANSVSLNAVSCPQCGHVFKQAGGINLSDPVHIAGLIVCAIILALAAFWIYGKLVGF